ncbi:MAG: phosphodiester glycosidase family protein [Acidimicrobiales bacterium]
MTRRSTTAAALVIASGLVSGVVGLLPGRIDAASSEPVPPAVGWRETSRTVDRGGIEIRHLQQDDPLTRATAAIVPRSQLARLRTVLASDQLVEGTGRELPTTMCAELHCHVAVNGDRYALSGHDAGRPVGAVAIDGDLIATQPLPPEDPYAHLLIGDDGSMDGTIEFPIPVTPEVASGDVVLPVAVNRQPSGDQISVLDERYNPNTRTPAGTVEYLLGDLGGEAEVRSLSPLERREGSGPIPKGGMVLAANGPTAIDAAEAWWAAALEVGAATYSSGIGDVKDIIGGSPLLLDATEYGFPLDRSDGRNPRTIIGWDATRLFLVTVDGRLTDWSVGVTYIEAAQLMRWLGATDAINVDGGSSSTFVDHGLLANKPSAGVQLAAVEALVVMPPENRIGTPPPPRSLDPACPPGRVPPNPFSDSVGNVHEAAIACMAWWQVTTGTGLGTYAPGSSVRRDQMASFLARLLYVSGVPFPSNPPDAFPDDDSSVHEPFINAMAAIGVIGGQVDGTFVPSGAVTRGQMATFLARAMPLATRAALANTTDYFADDSGHTHELSINQITEALVAGGTTDGLYEPGASVRRDQMASFLARALSAAVEAGWAHPPG